MSAATPTIYVIAGCNGAGKTTFAGEFLPKEVKCLRFLNADEIARGLSPFNPGASAVKAARLLLAEFKIAVKCGESFALESTLSGRSYVRLLREAKRTRHEVQIHFLWLPDPALAIARVRERVTKGGHDVPVLDIRRRFGRGLQNFLHEYAPLADGWTVWDNSKHPPKLLADSDTCTLLELQVMLRP